MTEAEVISAFSICRMALHRIRIEGRDLYRDAELVFSRIGENGAISVVQEGLRFIGGKEGKKKTKRTKER